MPKKIEYSPSFIHSKKLLRPEAYAAATEAAKKAASYLRLLGAEKVGVGLICWESTGTFQVSATGTFPEEFFLDNAGPETGMSLDYYSETVTEDDPTESWALQVTLGGEVSPETQATLYDLGKVKVEAPRLTSPQPYLNCTL